jgi:hypothetical protein
MTRAMPPLLLGALFAACAGAGTPTATTHGDPVDVPPAAPDAGETPAANAAPREDPCAPGRYCPGAPSNVLLAELRSVAAQTRACYERALKENPALEGRLAVALRVLEDGRACRAELTDDALQGGPDFQSCVVDTFARQLPAPQGGCVNTVVPLNFKIKQTDGGAGP